MKFITAIPEETLKFSDYVDACFLLGKSQEPQSFIRSTFDYGGRQRRAIKGYVSYSAQMILEFYQLKNFQAFWEDLDEGTNIFLYSGTIHGDTSEKQVRFSTPYSLDSLGGNNYRVSVMLEIVQTGASIYSCPLVPSDTVIPQDGLMPC